MTKKKYDIFSYEELQQERMLLKQKIIEQENSLKENPVVKIANSFNGSKSVTGSVKEALSEFNFQSGETLISSLLLASKATRKYFIGYTVAKEMVPYLLQKVKEVLKSKKELN